jgi:predicted RNA-binding protein with PUA-like domain
MAYFLAKTDPEDYPVELLERDGTTVWNGVRNAQAVRAIRAMRPGDVVFVYHSGGESAIRAIAEVVSEPRDDPDDPRSAVVDLRFVQRLENPVTLQAIKKLGLFDDWALVRQSRLSTMAAPKTFADFVKLTNPKLKI